MNILILIHSKIITRKVYTVNAFYLNLNKNSQCFCFKVNTYILKPECMLQIPFVRFSYVTNLKPAFSIKFLKSSCLGNFLMLSIKY